MVGGNYLIAKGKEVMKSMYSLFKHYPTRTKFTTISNDYVVKITGGRITKRQTSCYYTYNILDLFLRHQELNYLLGLNKRRYF